MTRTARRQAVLTLSAVALVLAYVPAGHAAGPFNPTTTADGGSGSGSLRDAIIQANAAGGATTINLAAGQIYQLTIPDAGSADEDVAQTGDLDISANITIHGNGATIAGTPVVNRRIFEVRPGATLTLDHVTITGGFAGCGEPPISSGDVEFDGGGIQNNSGTLSLSHVTVRDNGACGGGGGIASSGFASLSIDSSTISGNSASKGGGIANALCNCGKTHTIVGSTISGNSAQSGGGGIYNVFTGSTRPNWLTIDASTMANNVGGALLNNGSATLTNVTVAHNISLSPFLAGGIGNAFSGSFGVFISLRNSVIAGNENSAALQYADCDPGFGSIQSLGNNLRSSTGCDASAGWQASDPFAANPGLGGLGHFGGPTQTVRLEPASPAIDAGNDAFFRGTDQRGVAQFGSHADIGAFEYVPGATASFDASDMTPLDGAAVTFANTSYSSNAGTITSFWDFGDGTSSVDTNPPLHSFAAPDHPHSYTVTLNIVDDAGSADEASVTIAAHPANEKPTAAFTSDFTSVAAGQAVSFNASTSGDPDGTIAGYAWDWSDGGFGAGALASHAWATPGTFIVTLTVTDNGGRTDSVSGAIAVHPIDFYVDDDWVGTAPGADPDGAAGPAGSFGSDAFATLTDALDAANAGVAGSTIHVAAGSYTEGSLSLSLNGMRLLGAGRATTQVSLDSLYVGGQSAIIDGFAFSGAGGFAPVIRLGGAGDQQVRNNRIAGGRQGVFIESNTNLVQGNIIEQAAFHGISIRADNNVITGNTITDNGTNYPAAKEASGIEIGGSSAVNGNVISSNAITASAFAGVKLGNAAGSTISGNTISGTRNGGATGDPADAGAGGSAILITHNTATNTTITGNQLGPNSGYGILQVDSAGASTGNVAHLNAIVGNLLGGVFNRDVAPVAVFDARDNWWGATDGPRRLPAGPGSGDSVSTSTSVLVDPFPTSAACFGLNACPLQLVVTQQPGNAFAEVPFGTQPVIQVQDVLGNVQNGSSAAITASILPGTGKPAAVLGGTMTVNAVGGMVTFTNLQIDRAGNGYKLHFTTSGVSAADSNPFNVVGSTVTGHVYNTTAASPLVGAKVQVCKGSICAMTTTIAGGVYTVSGVSPGNDVFATAFPPSGANSLAPNTIGPLVVPGSGGTISGQDIILTAPTGPPAGTGVSPSSPSPSGVPVVLWTNPFTLFTSGCPGGTASYTITINGSVVRAGGMVAGFVPGTYSVLILPLAPGNGPAHIAITIVCPSGPPVTIEFDMYIDPSGIVQRPDGTPVAGATVTLFRLDEAMNTFVQVPDGDAVMSPANRLNPDRSNAVGQFGWDAIAGIYKVGAEKAGCHAVGSAASFVETGPFQVPPPKDNLVLVLDCPNNATLMSIVSSANPSASGQAVTFTATVTSGGSPLSLGSVSFSEGGVALGPPVSLDDDGHARLTTSALSPVPHGIQADYLPVAGYDSSHGNLTQTVQSANSYRICPLYDPLVMKKSGSTYPIKLQLCDSSGRNLSSPSIVVHAVSVTRTLTNGGAPLDDSGHANPDFDFRYDPSLGGYIFNLSTKGIAPGTYNLNFSAGEDPVVHSARFAVK